MNGAFAHTITSLTLPPVDEDIQEMYTLDSVITVVDAKHILTRLAEEKP